MAARMGDHMAGPGRILFAVSFILLGALCIAWHGVFQAWEPLPKWFAWKDAYGTAAGVIMLASGAALLVPRAMRSAALVLAGFLLLQTLVLYTRRIVLYPLVEVVYESLGEALIYIVGAWTVFSISEGAALAKFANVRAGQIVFGLALLPIGLSHFFYMNMTAPLIPSWLPFHVPLGYFTGACHFAAGLGILFGVLPRIAATLEAVMVSLFTLIVWVPRIIESPQTQSNWSEICASAAISGAAWIVAGAFRRAPQTV